LKKDKFLHNWNNFLYNLSIISLLDLKKMEKLMTLKKDWKKKLRIKVIRQKRKILKLQKVNVLRL